jgi:hypothetical protein
VAAVQVGGAADQFGLHPGQNDEHEQINQGNQPHLLGFYPPSPPSPKGVIGFGTARAWLALRMLACPDQAC